MHPYGHALMQGRRENKEEQTKENKKTIKMLIVLYGTNMWRGESGGFSCELSPTWTNIASVQ